MLYNERVTTDATPSVKIYEGNQGQAMMKEGAAVKQQAAREMQQAKELEEKSYKLSMMKGMNELWQNEQLSSNPQALASEMDKLSQKVTSNISDMDMRVNVLTDFELKKDSYINQATTKMKKIQEEKARSAAFDSIYANIDSLGMSFGNGVSGNFTEGDVVNYQYSLDRIKANINAKAPDGTYLFTDAQRRAMARDADQAIRQGFINTYAELPEAEQERITKALNDGTYTVANFGLKDLTGESSFYDIKREVNKYNSAVLSERIKQRKYQGLKAIEDFMDNKTQANYDKLVELNPEMSDNTKEKYQEILENTPNYEANTVFDGAKDAERAAKEFLNIQEGTEEDNAKILDDLANYVKKLQRSNYEKKLSTEDVENFTNIAYKAVNDKVFRAQVNAIFGEDSTFDTVARWVLPQREMQKVEQIGGQTISSTVALLLQGDAEKARRVYKEGQRLAIQTRYPEIPFKDLKEGDVFWYTPTKRAFKFVGYSLDDVLVEVDPNTGAKK